MAGGLAVSMSHCFFLSLVRCQWLVCGRVEPDKCKVRCVASLTSVLMPCGVVLGLLAPAGCMRLLAW